MKGWNLPDNVSPNDESAPWNKKDKEGVFAIKHSFTGELWSNDVGWVEDDFSIFTEEEKATFSYIPLYSEWIEL